MEKNTHLGVVFQCHVVGARADADAHESEMRHQTRPCPVLPRGVDERIDSVYDYAYPPM